MPINTTQNDDGLSPSNLPPSLCHTCRYGIVQQEASPLHGSDDEDFWLHEIRAVARETSYCRNPLICGSPRDPLQMENVILRCGGYSERPIRVTNRCPKAERIPRKRARKGRARDGRRGPR